MGGGSSTGGARYMNGTLNEIVSVMMPVYYTEEEITEQDLNLAIDCWQHIVSDTSPEFKMKKETDPSFQFSSCVSWFFSNFYARLFDVHPMCRSLFKTGLQTQGRFLISMVSLCINQLKREKVR